MPLAVNYMAAVYYAVHHTSKVKLLGTSQVSPTTPYILLFLFHEVSCNLVARIFARNMETRMLDAAIRFAAALLTLLVAVSGADAQTLLSLATTTESGEFTYPISEPSSGSRDFSIQFAATNGHSYCCEIALANGRTPAVLDQAFFTSMQNVFANSAVTNADRGTSDPYIPFINGHPNPAAARKCAITPLLDFVRLGINIGADNALSADYEAQCVETTMFGGFNTSVTDFNFLEIRNTLNRATDASETITVRIDATNVVNNSVVFNSATLSLPAGSRRDIDIHSVAGPRAFGPIRLSHDGPPGSIKAVVSQYRVVATSPLDFEPVAREVLTTRARN